MSIANAKALTPPASEAGSDADPAARIHAHLDEKWLS
jgi:hypothetical protein